MRDNTRAYKARQGEQKQVKKQCKKTARRKAKAS